MVGHKLQKPPIHKPLFYHKPFNTPYLKKKIPARSRLAKTTINMAVITTDEGITRRIGNHHPNLWDDDFIQSLPKAYEWEVYIDAYMKEAEWLAMGYTPSLEEYLENGKVSAGSRVLTLQPVLTLDAPLSDEILKEIDYPSRFDELLCLTLRLRGDTRTFKAEADRGEVVSCITCYMKDHPESNEEDALNYLNSLIDERLKELNWEYLKSHNVPLVSKDNAYNLSKGLQLFYKERDGFSVSNIETKNLISKIMIEPIPI
ncbi:hypothetical protein SUGI_0709710 [Cryptomeria japonica]|nr:hypothetical protein SUGI_0709710 [Cryptomeria japonica]